MKEQLQKHDFKFKKSLGQNFISDTNLLNAIVSDAGITADDCVLEIGAGAGTLTSAIAKVATKVLSIETDKSLKPILAENLAEYNNVNFIFDDFMKVDFSIIKQILGNSYKVVANLPYYITTPILFRFFEEDSGCSSLTIMVQKEVAERMVAKPNSNEYGVLSVQCQFFATPQIMRIVGKKNFHPQPKVDSAIIRLDFQNTACDKKSFSTVVRTAFSMRRKTLQNNLKGKYSKEELEKAQDETKISMTKRAEDLSVSDYVKLVQYFQK